MQVFICSINTVVYTCINTEPEVLLGEHNVSENFCLILFIGQDSVLRSFSTIHESESKSLGRASYNKSETKKAGLLRDRHMMPPITVFAAGNEWC